MAPEEEAEQARKRTEELAKWARSPFPPAGEGYPLRQMGADGKRKARYKRKEQHDSGAETPGRLL